MCLNAVCGGLISATNCTYFLINTPSQISLHDVRTDTFIQFFFRGFKYSYRHFAFKFSEFLSFAERMRYISHPHTTKGRKVLRNDSTDRQVVNNVLAKWLARVSLNVTSRKKEKTLSHSGEGDGHLKIKVTEAIGG